MGELTVFVNKDIPKQIQKLYQKGGNFQKAAEKAKAFLWDIVHTKELQEVIENYKYLTYDVFDYTKKLLDKNKSKITELVGGTVR
jgi:hypothetical protein